MPEPEDQDRPSDCTEVAELLPVYLNRSLEAKAARRVEAHLASCAACRQEERDTRTAWALYEGHLPVELLLDYALAQPLPSQGVAVVESHLAACERCSDELAIVRQENTMSRRRAPDVTTAAARVTGAKVAGPSSDRPRPAASASYGRLRTLAWAASIAAIVASTGWLWTWRQLAEERTVSPPEARANLTVVELLPATPTLLRRGSTDPRAMVNRVELTDGCGELVLVLLSAGGSCESTCLLEITGTEGALPKQRVEGLAASPDGHLTLALPADWLLPDGSVLAVRDQATGELVAEYLVEIHDPASGAS